VLSILGSLLLYFPVVLGFLAIYFSSQVDRRFSRGDVAGAERASNSAKAWGVVSIVVGLLGLLVTIA